MARGQLEFGTSQQDDEEHTDDALAALGLCIEDGFELEQDECWLWPENDEAFGIWLSLQTQWNVGMAGATGLSYQGVEICLRMRGLKKKVQQNLFLLIQMMERACLEEWARQRKT